MENKTDGKSTLITIIVLSIFIGLLSSYLEKAHGINFSFIQDISCIAILLAFTIKREAIYFDSVTRSSLLFLIWNVVLALIFNLNRIEASIIQIRCYMLPFIIYMTLAPTNLSKRIDNIIQKLIIGFSFILGGVGILEFLTQRNFLSYEVHSAYPDNLFRVHSQ